MKGNGILQKQCCCMRETGDRTEKASYQSVRATCLQWLYICIHTTWYYIYIYILHGIITHSCTSCSTNYTKINRLAHARPTMLSISLVINQHYGGTPLKDWGERERAPPLMMTTALASVRPSVRPRTFRRLRMRDIHVIYADLNSAGFKNRLLLKWSQCKHSKKGTVRRDWNDVDNRNGRDVLEKRQRRETEGAVFETRGTGKEDGLDVLRDVLLRLRSLSAYVHV